MRLRDVLGANTTPVIDTHLHFWDLATYGHDEWLRESPSIHRSFLPPDVKSHFQTCGVDLGVVIEAGRSHRLNLWWLELAKRFDYLGAVVLGCSLEQDDLAARFDQYADSPHFVGVRTTPEGPADGWADSPATERGLRELVRRDLSLDLLVSHTTFPAVGELARRHPSLRIILDHCGNPSFRDGDLDAWRSNLSALAAHDNIWIKYSSLLFYTHPDSSIVRLQSVAQYLLETFGVQRMIWGSNWPVELLGGSYEQSFHSMLAAAEPLTASERAALLGGNALTTYRVRWTTP
jgi:L-fuconolactonase